MGYLDEETIFAKEQKSLEKLRRLIMQIDEINMHNTRESVMLGCSDFSLANSSERERLALHKETEIKKAGIVLGILRKIERQGFTQGNLQEVISKIDSFGLHALQTMIEIVEMLFLEWEPALHGFLESVLEKLKEKAAFNAVLDNKDSDDLEEDQLEQLNPPANLTEDENGDIK